MIVTTTARTQAPPATVLHLAGEVDTFAADDLRAHLRLRSLEPGDRVVVDLSAVTFMSCSALSVLAEAQGRLGRRLLLGRRSRIVRCLLEVTGLSSFFTLEAEDGAVRKPGGTDGSAYGSANGDRMSAPRPGVRTWTFSRTDLERLRGLLMGIHGCDVEQAWSMLAGAAARHGVPVGEIVELVIGGRRNSDPGQVPSSAAAIAALTLLMRDPDGGAADAGIRCAPTWRADRIGRASAWGTSEPAPVPPSPLAAPGASIPQPSGAVQLGQPGDEELQGGGAVHPLGHLHRGGGR